jgi:hypothetical protein
MGMKEMSQLLRVCNKSNEFRTGVVCFGKPVGTRGD